MPRKERLLFLGLDKFLSAEYFAQVPDILKFSRPVSRKCLGGKSLVIENSDFTLFNGN